MVFEELKVRFTGEDGLTGMLGKITGGMGGATKSGLAMGAMFAVVQMAMQQVMKVIHSLINFIKDSVKAYIEFEKGLAEVSTLLDDTSPLEGYAKGLRELAMASGESLDTLTKGLYQVISASVDAGAAMDVLTVANKAAIGGLSDTATAVDVITSIMNAYGYSAAEAERISDHLFTAVKYGKTTFAELAAGVGPVITMAANLGIEFYEVAASLATMTRSGIQTTNAVTYLRGMLRSVLKPTKQMKDMAKELGIVFDATSLKSMGLGGFLRYVSDAVGSNTEALSKLFPNIRGIQAVMALAGENADAFAGDLYHMEEAAGATDIAFTKMAGTISFELEQMRAKIKDTQLEIGEKMVPATLAWEQAMLYLASRIELIGNSIDWLMDRFAGVWDMWRDWGAFLFGGTEAVSEFKEVIKYTEEEITEFSATLSETIRTIGDYNESIGKATDEIKVLSDANVELLEKIKDLTRIKEITDDFKNLKLSTKDATYTQKIFDDELRVAQIELLKTKALLQDLGEAVDEYGDETKRNNLKVMKIRYKAKIEGRELTEDEEKQIEELELANEGLRIKIEEEAIKIDDIQEQALRDKQNRVDERKRQLEDEERALKDKAKTEIEKLREEVEANELAISTKLDQISQWAIERKEAIDTLDAELLSKLETFNEEELASIETQSGLKLGEIGGFIYDSEKAWYEHYKYLKGLWETYPSPTGPPLEPTEPEAPYVITKIEPFVGPIQPGREHLRPYYYTSSSGVRKTGLKGDYEMGQGIPWEHGGYVPKITEALLHPGEYVLPKKIVDLLDSLVSRPPTPSQVLARERSPISPSPVSETADTYIHFYGDIILHGVQDVDAFMEELHRRTRVAGARL